jgi:hypothetical protein
MMREAIPAEVIQRLGGPMRACSQCGRHFDLRGKENLTVYLLTPTTGAKPVAFHCSEECADKR